MSWAELEECYARSRSVLHFKLDIKRQPKLLPFFQITDGEPPPLVPNRDNEYLLGIQTIDDAVPAI